MGVMETSHAQPDPILIAILALLSITWYFYTAYGTRSWDLFQQVIEKGSYNLEGMPTTDVHLVTSPLGMTRPDSWFVRLKHGDTIFNILTGLNTTHWGLKIRDRFYDLKRKDELGRPSARGPRTAIQVADQHERLEGRIVSDIHLGKTHFTDEELTRIGRFQKPFSFSVAQSIFQEIICFNTIVGTTAGQETAKHLQCGNLQLVSYALLVRRKLVTSHVALPMLTIQHTLLLGFVNISCTPYSLLLSLGLQDIYMSYP